MILLLGATGYIGQAFALELRRRGECFIPLSRSAFDYTRFDLLFDYIRKIKPRFLINTASFTGRPNVDACESARMETFQANTLLPQTIARVCLMTNTPWGHISTGGIYSGAKVLDNGDMRVERDLNVPEIRRLFETHPQHFFGFTELDEPNFTFRHPPCNFYCGTKALAEEALRGSPQLYIWRVKQPFDEQDETCNLLTKLRTYPKVYDHITSLSHLGDFARACLELIERRSPFGIYNVTNPGAISTRQIVTLMGEILGDERVFRFWESETAFCAAGAKAPRSSCILDVTKLLRAGVAMRPVEQAIRDSLERWRLAGGKKETSSLIQTLHA